MSTHRKISRRTWLKGLAVFSAAAGTPLMLASTPAEAKASKGGCALPRQSQRHAHVATCASSTLRRAADAPG